MVADATKWFLVSFGNLGGLFMAFTFGWLVGAIVCHWLEDGAHDAEIRKCLRILKAMQEREKALVSALSKKKAPTNGGN